MLYLATLRGEIEEEITDKDILISGATTAIPK